MWDHLLLAFSTKRRAIGAILYWLAVCALILGGFGLRGIRATTIGAQIGALFSALWYVGWFTALWVAVVAALPHWRKEMENLGFRKRRR